MAASIELTGRCQTCLLPSVNLGQHVDCDTRDGQTLAARRSCWNFSSVEENGFASDRLGDPLLVSVSGKTAMSTETRRIRRIEVLLAEYEQNHNNPTNKAIHCFAVPVITWAALAMLWYIPTPTLFDRE